MFPQKSPIVATVDSKTYPLGEKSEHQDDGHALALVALSHTPVEHRLYSAMLSTPGNNSQALTFSARALMLLTGIRSLSTIRRGLEGLLLKLSIERAPKENGNGKREHGALYRVYQPHEIIARRNALSEDSAAAYSRVAEGKKDVPAFDRAIARIVDNPMLSRREAQVALCCVEGLTNAQIGERLDVTEQTVKFHLRHIFLKFGVKRRAELISRLLR